MDLPVDDPTRTTPHGDRTHVNRQHDRTTEAQKLFETLSEARFDANTVRVNFYEFKGSGVNSVAVTMSLDEKLHTLKADLKEIMSSNHEPASLTVWHNKKAIMTFTEDNTYLILLGLKGLPTTDSIIYPEYIRTDYK